jgi:hypothetical protein
MRWRPITKCGLHLAFSTIEVCAWPRCRRGRLGVSGRIMFWQFWHTIDARFQLPRTQHSHFEVIDRRLVPNQALSAITLITEQIFLQETSF